MRDRTVGTSARLSGFVRELRRRKVWQVGAIYVVAAAGVIGVAEAAVPALHLPDLALTLVVVFAALGFPIAVALAWTYDVTWGGVRNAERLEPVGEQPSSAATLDTADVSTDPAEVFGDVAEAAPTPGLDRSIVVLPFEDLSPDRDNEYFSDGLTEEIITDLSRLKPLRVISRTSAMVIKGSGKDVRAIGRELGVRYVLEGSVRKAGDRLRVTAQLIEAVTDAHLWAEKYDGKLGDVFEIQESVARSIADALEVELTPAERRRLSQRPIADPTAYEAYLRARQLIWEFTPQALARARQEMDNGLQLVGPNPLFYAGLAYVCWALYDSGAEHDEAVLEQGELYADRALELDPSLPQGWLGRGQIRYKRGDIGGYIRDLRQAVELGAGGDALFGLAFLLAEVGQMDEALERAMEATARDPLSHLAHLFRSVVDLFGGRLEAALAGMRLTRERLAPEDALLGWWHAQIAGYAGEEEEARRTAEQFATGGPPLIRDLCALLGAALDNDRAGVAGLLDRTDLRKFAETDEYFPVALANSLARVGELDEALHWVERAIGWGFTNHRFLGEHNRFLAPLRVKPRFIALMGTARRKQEEMLDDFRT